MKVTAIECPRCGQIIWSSEPRDRRICHCRYTTVKGGTKNPIYGWGLYGNTLEENQELINKFGEPKLIENFEVKDES